VEAGRQVIEAAIEADRPGDARRHLDAMAAHPDQKGVERLRRELEGRIAGADRDAAERRTHTGSFPTVVDNTADHGTPGVPGSGGGTTAGGPGGPVDVRDKGSRLLGFLRR